MKGTENERLKRAVGRLMDGNREALEVLRQTLDEDGTAEDTLGDLEDILEGGLEDARHPGDGRGVRSVIPLGRNLYLPWSSLCTVSTVEKMNPAFTWEHTVQTNA